MAYVDSSPDGGFGRIESWLGPADAAGVDRGELERDGADIRSRAGESDGDEAWTRRAASALCPPAGRGEFAAVVFLLQQILAKRRHLS